MNLINRRIFARTIIVGLVLLVLISTPFRTNLTKLFQEKKIIAYEEGDSCGNNGYLGPGDCEADTVNCLNVRKHYKCENHKVVSYFEQDNSCHLLNTDDCSTNGGRNGCNLCVVWNCPHGDTNHDGECTSADSSASHTGWQGSCSNPACGQIDWFSGTNWNNFCYTGFNNVGRCSSTSPTNTPTSVPPTLTPTITPTEVQPPTNTPTPPPEATNTPVPPTPTTCASCGNTNNTTVNTNVNNTNNVNVNTGTTIARAQTPPVKSIPKTGAETLVTLASLVSGAAGVVIKIKNRS